MTGAGPRGDMAAGTNGGEHMTTLIVDDDPVWCSIVSRRLEGTKFVAHDLGSAFHLIELYQPNVVLLDAILSDGVGWEAIPELRRLSPGTQFVVATAYESRTDRLRATAEMGALSYLEKRDGLDRIEQAVMEAFIASLGSVSHAAHRRCRA